MDPENWYVQFPMAAFNRLPELSGAEIKILLYIQRHTKNFGAASRVLSQDEIQYGRKRKDGSRMDTGTGLTAKTIRAAVESLAKKKLLFVSDEKEGYRAYSLQPIQKQAQQREKVSVSASLDREKVSVPARGNGEKFPGEAVKIPYPDGESFPTEQGKSISDSLDETALEEASPEGLDTQQETLQDTSIDTSIEEADLFGMKKALADAETEIQHLQEEARSTNLSKARKANERLRELDGSLPSLRARIAEKQRLLDTLSATLESEDTSETLEELAQTEPPRTSEHQLIDEEQKARADLQIALDTIARARPYSSRWLLAHKRKREAEAKLAAKKEQ